VHLRRGAGGGDIAEHRRRWRRKDAAFAKECDAAIEMAGSHVEVLAWERGRDRDRGADLALRQAGGHTDQALDCIFRMLLMASNRKKFGRMGAVKRKEIELELRARIEMELRAEVEADVRKRLLPGSPSDEEVREALTKALTAFRGARASRRRRIGTRRTRRKGRRSGGGARPSGRPS
jgi:hypothetical protein